MIASRLAALGLGPGTVRGIIVLTFALIGGLLAALAATWPGTPPVEAFLAGLAVLVDPNAAHAGTSTPAG